MKLFVASAANRDGLDVLLLPSVVDETVTRFDLVEVEECRSRSGKRPWCSEHYARRQRLQ